MLFKLKSLFVESSFESLLLFEIPGVRTICKDGLKVKFDLYFLQWLHYLFCTLKTLE